MKILAIDPGEHHMGLASFEDRQCIKAWEITPGEGLLFVADKLANQKIDVLVVEEFRLYAHTAKSLIGSELKTVECIGVLRYLWAMSVGGVSWVQQGASIQKPTAAILKARKIKSVAVSTKQGPHAKSAELHGWHFIMKQTGDLSKNN